MLYLVKPRLMYSTEVQPAERQTLFNACTDQPTLYCDDIIKISDKTLRNGIPRTMCPAEKLQTALQCLIVWHPSSPWLMTTPNEPGEWRSWNFRFKILLMIWDTTLENSFHLTCYSKMLDIEKSNHEIMKAGKYKLRCQKDVENDRKSPLKVYTTRDRKFLDIFL